MSTKNILFTPLRLIIVLLLFFLGGSALANAQNGITARVSVASDGTQGNGDSGYSSTFGDHFSAISANGRYVAFASNANNLVANDTNNTRDVFVRDRQTSQTKRVSVASNGTQGNTASVFYGLSISADGRYIAFDSSASNLVNNDTGISFDVFVYDQQTSYITRVSVASNGMAGNGDSVGSSISADGRYVAFVSGAVNLTSGDTNGMSDVFVHDRQTGQTSRVSVASNGTQGNGEAEYSPVISADGRYVAFGSQASNLVSGDSNGTNDVFIRDRQTGQTTRVSVASNGTQANGVSAYPSVSADGRYVAFVSSATNLVSGDTNGRLDVFVHDRQTGQTNRISVASSGAQGNSDSYRSTISADGRYIAFFSRASNLISGDLGGWSDIFIHDRQTGQTTLVSISSNGTQGNGEAGEPSISADGQHVVFNSIANNLAPGDTNGYQDVFVHDQVSAVCDNTNTSDTDGDGLLDRWEICGYDANGDGIIDVDLPTIGADYLKKDIFVEVDYMEDYKCLASICIGHTHRPKDEAVARVIQAFANALISNPDNTTGIALHVDISEAISHQNTLQPTNETWNWSGFDRIKNNQGHFDPKRAKIFHYAVFAHDIGGDFQIGTSGISRNDVSSDSAFRQGASDFVISLGQWTNSIGTVNEQAGTFMHELGHNLGLRHGGDDHQNFEPNYLSVMNYSFQTNGLVVNSSDGLLDYSRFGSIPLLNEAHLTETVGLNGGLPISTYGTRYYCRPSGNWQNRRVTNVNAPIDWNCNGNAGSTDIQANINDGLSSLPDPTISTLTGFDDWSAIVFDGGSIGLDNSAGIAGLILPQSLVSMTELTINMDNQFYKPFNIALNGSSDMVASLGITTTTPITLSNLGALTSTVSLSYTLGDGWFNLSAIPISVTLVPGASLSIPITVTVPSSHTGDISDGVIISATAQEATLIGDSAALNVIIGPLAQYVVEPVRGKTPLTVVFTDTSIGPISSWLWDFGDGMTSAQQNPTHLYPTGTYTVTLTVSGPDGSDTESKVGLVTSENKVYLPFIGK